MRRRGFTPTSINNFCREIGITRNDNIIPMHKLEHHIRSDLDATSPRTLAVLKPLKVRGFSLKSSSTAQNSKLLLPLSQPLYSASSY
jgi:glutamyl/glutaminyl-tRNA synthetase